MSLASIFDGFGSYETQRQTGVQKRGAEIREQPSMQRRGRKVGSQVGRNSSERPTKGAGPGGGKAKESHEKGTYRAVTQCAAWFGADRELSQLYSLRIVLKVHQDPRAPLIGYGAHPAAAW